MNSAIHFNPPGRQQGISLVMSLIMLVVLTMIAASATYSTNSSVRIVGNMQMQDEALTAAQQAIDEQLDKLANFTSPAAKQVPVDMNRDSTNDYTVAVATPVCVSKEPKPGNSAKLKGEAAQSTFWDVAAVVEDARTGARASVNQGVKIDMLPYQGCM